MGPTPDRRDFLGLLLGGAAGFALPSTAFGQRPAAASATPLAATPLSDNLIHLSGAGGNVIAAVAPESVLMVNGGLEEHSRGASRRHRRHAGGKKIQYLFNTDWHREHTGSNEALAKSGATIVAHEHTKQYLGAEIYVDWQKQTYKPLPSAALPTKTFYTSGTMTFGTERVEYGHLGQAHTDGDIYVSLPGRQRPRRRRRALGRQIPDRGLHDRRLARRLAGREQDAARRSPNAETRIVPGYRRRCRRAPICRRSTTCWPR